MLPLRGRILLLLWRSLDLSRGVILSLQFRVSDRLRRRDMEHNARRHLDKHVSALPDLIILPEHCIPSSPVPGWAFLPKHWLKHDQF